LLKARIPDYAGLTDQVEKLIQIIRSTPAVISPLIGQKKSEHVLQNIKIANIPPLSNLEYKKTIQMLFNSNT
jgi:aryl-alcohol dehydrogenase-like predicted oxidoreductase